MLNEVMVDEVWSLYMLRCSDNSIYTGISNNVARRVMVHFSGAQKSSKYVKAKKPLKLIFTAELGSHSFVSQLESKVKKLPKKKKESIATGELSLRELFLDHFINKE